nr:hypothetical protein [Deinococcus sp.]
MSVPDGLFDLAINRAANLLRGLPSAGRAAALAEWHARTRFARRVPLEQIWHCLDARPDGEYYWAGGPDGTWQPGKAAFP